MWMFLRSFQSAVYHTTHLSVKRHLKAWWILEITVLLSLFSCTKLRDDFVSSSYKCVFILSQPSLTQFPLCPVFFFFYHSVELHSFEPCKALFGKLCIFTIIFIEDKEVLWETVSIIVCIFQSYSEISINRKIFCSRLQATDTLVWLFSLGALDVTYETWT